MTGADLPRRLGLSCSNVADYEWVEAKRVRVRSRDAWAHGTTGLFARRARKKMRILLALCNVKGYRMPITLLQGEFHGQQAAKVGTVEGG